MSNSTPPKQSKFRPDISPSSPPVQSFSPLSNHIFTPTKENSPINSSLSTTLNTTFSSTTNTKATTGYFSPVHTDLNYVSHPVQTTFDPEYIPLFPPCTEQAANVSYIDIRNHSKKFFDEEELTDEEREKLKKMKEEKKRLKKLHMEREKEMEQKRKEREEEEKKRLNRKKRE